MVGHQVLALVIGVRVPTSEQIFRFESCGPSFYRNRLLSVFCFVI